MSLLARDLMQTRVHVVSPRITLPELERELIARGVKGFPVVDGGKLVGIISRSDIVRQLCAERSLAEIIADYQDVSDDTVESSRRAAASQADVGAGVGRRIDQLRVSDVMIHDVVAVEPTTTLADLARAMHERHIHRLPVVEGGRLVGIISAIDLARLVAEGRLVQA